MKFRMNGHTFRSASDIAQIIASIPTEKPSSEEIERRVQLRAERFANGLDLWTGEKLHDVSGLEIAGVEDCGTDNLTIE